MRDKNVYAMNTVSGVVAQVPESVLSHPVLGRVLVQVEAPGTCIDCGVQPESVVEVAPEPASDPEPVSEPKPRRASRNTKKEK